MKLTMLTKHMTMSTKQVIFLMVVALFSTVGTLSPNKHKKRHLVKSRQISSNNAEQAWRRGDITLLPTLEELLKEKNEGGETKFTFEGCDIVVTHNANNLQLDLKDENCQDIMSVPRLYGKLTGGNNLDDALGFLPLKKFNVEGVSVDVESKSVKMICLSKESFTLFRGTNGDVEKGKLTMTYTMQSGAIPFEAISFHLTGDVQVGEQILSLSLVKKESSNLGEVDLVGEKVKIKDFFDVFSTGSETTDKRSNDVDPKQFPAMFSDTYITAPKIIGSRDGNGYSEIVASGASPEEGGASFQVLVQVQPGKPPQAAIISKFTQVKPAVVLGKLLNKDVTKVPVVDDITVDAVVEFSNDDIGAPSDEEVVKLLKETAPTSMIEVGTKLKLKVPFRKLIEKHGVTETSNLDRHLRIEIANNRQLSFIFPDEAPMTLEDILLAFGVKISPSFRKVFPNKVLLRISTYDVDFVTDAVDIALETADAVVVGKNLLTVQKATFELKKERESDWEFDMSADMMIGDGTFKITVSKKAEAYSLIGKIGHLNALDFIDNFNITSKAAKLVRKMPSLNMGIKDFVMSAEYEDEKLKLKLTGEVTFLRWTIQLEGYVQKNDDDEYDMAIGFVIPGISINDLAKELFAKIGKQIDLVKAEWLSHVTVSIMIGNHGEVEFNTPQLKEMTDITKKPFLDPVALSEDDGGASILATVAVPPDCRGETLCEYVKKAVGGGARLELMGTITPEGVSLKISFSVEIRLSDKFTLKEASLLMRVGEDTEFAIVGICEVTFEKHGKMTFRGRLKQSISGKFTLTFSMAGMWDKPFGIKNLQFGNFEMEVGVNFVTLMPTFLLTAELHFGYPGTAIKAELSGGFESGTPPGFYFYAKFNKLSIAAIFEAFNVQKKIPKALQNSGFPDGLVVGVSLPNSKRIEMLNVDLNAGFMLQGTFQILGFTMHCELEVGLPETFILKAEFSKIKLAGGAIEMSGFDRSEGPKLEITLGTEEDFEIKIDAYVEVLKMGAGVKMTLNDDGLEFQMAGRFLDLFEASVDLSIPSYGSLVEAAASEWKVQFCISDYVRDAVKDGALVNVDESANQTMAVQNENYKVNGESSAWFDKAMEKVNYWKEKLLRKEAKFKKFVDKVAESKKEMDKSCVEKCDKRKVWVGGFGEKTCEIAGKTVVCPFWDKKKWMRDDPLCLSECESGKVKVFTKLKSFAKEGDLMIMEEKMEFYSKMLDKVNAFVMSSKSLMEGAELAAKKVGEMAAATGNAMTAVKQYTLKNLFYIHHICVSGTLNHGEKGPCFNVDAEFYIGGTKGTPVIFKEEQCLNLDWAKELGQLVARKAFPGIETIKEKYYQTKELLARNKKQAEDMGDESKELEKKSKREQICESENPNVRERRCKDNIYKKLVHYRSQSIFDDLQDLVVRNDRSMQAFRDLFSNMTDQPTRRNIKETTNATSDNNMMMNALNFDTLAATQRTDVNTHCKRSKAVVSTYAGVLQSINALMAKNNDVKRSYEKFIKEYSDTFEALERKIRNDSIANNMKARDTNKALFYVHKAKQGIAKWKVNYDLNFQKLDKSSLRNWRGLMGQYAADQKLDVNSYLDRLGTISSQSAKRMEVPTEVKKELSKTFSIAEQVVRNLLQDDEKTFSSKTPSIKLLIDEVNTMNTLKKKLNCL